MSKGIAHEIHQDYLRVKQELGRHPTRDDYQRHGKFPKSAIKEAFGGWTAFLQASGIQYSQKGRQNKQELRLESYEHMLKEIERFRSEPIIHEPCSSLLVAGDMHAPYMHPDYANFLIGLAREYGCTRIASVGDEIDAHAMSFHDHDPDLLSPGHELEAAIRQLEPLYKAFPVMDLAESNHGSLVYRKGKHHGLPRNVLKSYQEVLRAPPGWRWHFKIVVPLSNGTSVDIHHSYGANALAQSKKRGRSLIQGHHHNDAGVQWWGTDERDFFAAFTGCGIDDVALAFAYNKNQVERPRLGALLVLDGIPHWKPMLLDHNRRWTGFIP